MGSTDLSQQRLLLGHPAGLFTLFFAEMWERFSYYGMRALLVLYMIKGFLKYSDADAYTVYGAYAALIYMTPFFGGMLADRLLGARRAVVLGGLLMSAGHLVMVFENIYAFYTALALLITGNGFFKPNISTMVGDLYPKGSPRRDGGFIIFYMGINLGAAISPLLCGYIGETYGWHWGFGLATIGMLTGLTVFVAPTRVAQLFIFGGAIVAAWGLVRFRPDSSFALAVNFFVAASLLIAAVIAWIALGRGGVPAHAGAPPDRQRLRRPVGGLLSAEWTVYLSTLLAVPVFMLVVSGFAPLTSDNRALSIMPEAWIEHLSASDSPMIKALAALLEEISKPAGLVLTLAGVVALIYLLREMFKLSKIPRERLLVALILTFCSMLFWTFFEQAGSSINNFTDRNVDRVVQSRVVNAGEVGQTLRLQPTQEQVGFHNGSDLFTLNDLDGLREAHAEEPDFQIDWVVAPDNAGMGIAQRNEDIPASVFQSVNAVYILVFGLVFTALWALMNSAGLEPSTPVKFALGLLQLGLGFVALWYGAQHADSRGMVAMSWLLMGYLLHTTGELCVSPVGLSMITKLSPAHLVSTMMGNWFLATAFSEYLAAIVAQFTGVGGGDAGGSGDTPVPLETVQVYGEVFGKIAIAVIVAAVVCFALAPLLARWMHADTLAADGGKAQGAAP